MCASGLSGGEAGGGGDSMARSQLWQQGGLRGLRPWQWSGWPQAQHPGFARPSLSTQLAHPYGPSRTCLGSRPFSSVLQGVPLLASISDWSLKFCLPLAPPPGLCLGGSLLWAAGAQLAAGAGLRPEPARVPSGGGGGSAVCLAAARPGARCADRRRLLHAHDGLSGVDCQNYFRGCAAGGWTCRRLASLMQAHHALRLCWMTVDVWRLASLVGLSAMTLGPAPIPPSGDTPPTSARPRAWKTA